MTSPHKLVVDEGLEPDQRTNQVLRVYKAQRGVPPYRQKKIWEQRALGSHILRRCMPLRKHSSAELGSHRTWYAASESNTSCLGVDQMHTASLLAAYRKLVARPGVGPGPDGLR